MRVHPDRGIGRRQRGALVDDTAPSVCRLPHCTVIFEPYGSEYELLEDDRLRVEVGGPTGRRGGGGASAWIHLAMAG
jgi:hypothetical protein